jgi:CrcB protein
VLGFLVTLGTGRIGLSTEARLLFAIGFLGTYTTFSSYSVETVTLLQNGSAGRALINVLANNLGGLAAAWVGVILARILG